MIGARRKKVHMEHPFDDLAKALAGGMSRREAFRRFGGGLIAGVLAVAGLAAQGQDNDCGKFCAECCRNLNPPPRGQEMGECLRSCHEGGGICGPIVCPGGHKS